MVLIGGHVLRLLPIDAKLGSRHHMLIVTLTINLVLVTDKAKVLLAVALRSLLVTHNVCVAWEVLKCLVPIFLVFFTCCQIFFGLMSICP